MLQLRVYGWCFIYSLRLVLMNYVEGLGLRGHEFRVCLENPNPKP